MKRAWLYSRYSTSGQNESSIERQNESAELWCKSKGYQLLGSYADRGQSGSIPFLERPELKALLNNPELKAGDRILIEKLDRITRAGELERMEITRYFLDRGLELWLVDENRDALALDLPSLLTTIIATSTDKSKKDEAVKRSVEGKKIKMRNAIQNGGERVSRVCPPWLRLSGDKTSFEPIPERIDIIKMIFKLSASLGAGRICNELNSKGIEGWAKVKKSSKWSKGSNFPKFINLPASESEWQIYQIKKLLRDRRLLGELDTANFGVATGYYPAVLSETDLILAENSLKSRKKKTAPNSKAFKNIFTGIARCVSCKSPIHCSSKGNGYNYMICSKGCDKVERKPMRYELFEKSFLKWAVEIDWSVFMGYELTTNAVKVDMAKNDKLAEELERKIDNLVNSMADSANVRLVAKIDEFESELTNVKSEGERLNLVLKAEIVKENSLKDLDLSWAEEAINSGNVELRAKLNAQLSDRLDFLWLSLGNNPRPYFATVINGRKQVVFILDDASYQINYDESDDGGEINSIDESDVS